MLQSLTTLGLDVAEQKALFSTLSGLLHLGNVSFVTAEETDVTSIAPQSATPIANVAALLGYRSRVDTCALC